MIPLPPPKIIPHIASSQPRKCDMGERNRDSIQQIEMNSDNRALFIFGFVFYFLGDLATTCIGISNGIPEKGFISMLGIFDYPPEKVKQDENCFQKNK